MKTKELICVSCPIGCAVTVTLDDNNEVVSVTDYPGHQRMEVRPL